MRVYVTLLACLFVHNTFGTRVILVENAPTCFRRVLVGRRALRSHVRRVVSGQSLEDCKTECAVEHRFPCESFNYRLDPSFRGKSLCELMTKPIEAFDLRRDFAEDKDYDFYERDRNSLEPYCPDSLRGQGLLHSGYLTTQNRAEDRWGGGYVGSYGQRKHDDTNFIPYQIGIRRKNDPREHENWGQYGGYYGGYDYYKDRNDYYKSQSHWNLNNAIDRAYSSEGVRPLTTIIRPHKSMADFDYNKLAKDTPWNERYGSWKREKWNSSGSSFNSFDYGGYHHYGPTFELEGRSDENDPKDCSSRRSAGMSLSSGSIRRSLYAKNVVECEASCFEEREFKCVSYSYRYSNSRGSDNCFLSERPYRGLEMSADSSSDVYAMPQSHDCVNVNYDPWVESECFWHVRSGAAVTGAAVRAALTVAGLGACEAECIRASGFFCRGFSFRFEAPITGEDLENCILTSSPPASLPPSRAAHHELYARGRAGRGCQPALHDAHPEPGTQCYLQYDSAAQLSPSAVRGRARVRDEGACGVACTDAPFRCLSYSFKNNAPPDRDNCFLSEIRLFDLQRGVDYVHSTDDWLFAFDLFNGQCWRKIHGPDYDEPTHELPRPILTSGSEESYPVSGPSGPGYSESDPPYISEGHIKPFKPTIYKPVYPEPSGPDFEPHYETSGHFYKPTYSIEPSGSYKPGFAEPSGPDFKPHFEPVGPVLKPVYPLNEPPFESSRPGLKPLYPVQPNFKPRPVEPSVYRPEYPVQKPGYVPKPAYRPPEHDIPFVPTSPPGYRPGRPGFNPGSKPGFEGDREDGIAVSWRHYTVSGFPCRAGTSCAQNHVAGHWACEPEGGEIGSWDYCCAPTHRCGYSEGFNKPWCYVGPESDQWRPCSEKYYPYHQHNVPHPSQANRDETSQPSGPSRPHGNRLGPYLSEADRRYWDELYKNGPQAYYDRYGNPLPGYTRVPTSDPPHIKPEYSRPAPGSWAPAQGGGTRDGLGVPRYWPVAYLHKGPPPNMTYFRYNETTTTEMPKPAESRDLPDDRDSPDQQTLIDKPKIIDNHRGEKKRNISEHDEEFHIDIDKTTTAKTVSEVTEVIERVNKSETESTTSDKDEDKMDLIDGIDDKLLDFSKSIEVFDIEDAKKSAKADLKTLRAEERQIEEIGRLLASRRDGKVVLEKRSQKELASKNIAVDEDLLDFNFGNKFPVERRGVVRKVTKDEIERDRNTDRSLEVSETTFVRPPRVLATTENIRKAIVNGKIFYDATIREQRDVLMNATRRSKSLRPLEDRAPSVINSASFGKKKIIKTRNVNPVRRVRRVYRKRYNPEEVRRRLLERDRAKESSVDSSRKI
ncbi:uncharacterized protein LOC114241919 isoform X1 [Bombyx mandarina]|uniref:Uncharacterized protein LOC114241919 isoform X1 n=1 Tax=Bombyx mandarina TaxID=7092 RepID=A0A6J2JGR9_BOMMA|nr:uncharacterized protein LOC114241919 isoform X1 [Bombyx mandarina]